jgi:hypothetical protein
VGRLIIKARYFEMERERSTGVRVNKTRLSYRIGFLSARHPSRDNDREHKCDRPSVGKARKRARRSFRSLHSRAEQIVGFTTSRTRKWKSASLEVIASLWKTLVAAGCSYRRGFCVKGNWPTLLFLRVIKLRLWRENAIGAAICLAEPRPPVFSFPSSSAENAGTSAFSSARSIHHPPFFPSFFLVFFFSCLFFVPFNRLGERTAIS